MGKTAERSYKCLTIDKKREILIKLKKGTKGVNLAKEYCVSNATITRIRKEEPAILKATTPGQKKLNRLSKFDDFLVAWIKLYRAKNIPVSGPLICAKALEINAKYKLKEDFKVILSLHSEYSQIIIKRLL